MVGGAVVVSVVAKQSERCSTHQGIYIKPTNESFSWNGG